MELAVLPEALIALLVVELKGVYNGIRGQEHCTHGR